MIIHSYIGQQPVYSEALKCHIYPAPDYEAPEFVSVKQLQKEREKFVTYSNHFTTRRAKFRDEVIALFRDKGPMTTRIMAKHINKTASALYNVLHDRAGVFVVLGKANDGLGSAIYGLPGQTLDDVTQCLDVEFAYKRIAKFLEENGPSFPGDIAKALNLKNAVVSSALSDYPNLFVKQDKSRSRPIWMRKVA